MAPPKDVCILTPEPVNILKKKKVEEGGGRVSVQVIQCDRSELVLAGFGDGGRDPEPTNTGSF